MKGQHIVVDEAGNIVAEYVTIMFDGVTIGELRDNHYYMNNNERDKTACLTSLAPVDAWTIKSH